VLFAESLVKDDEVQPMAPASAWAAAVRAEAVGYLVLAPTIGSPARGPRATAWRMPEWASDSCPLADTTGVQPLMTSWLLTHSINSECHAASKVLADV
jgi:hypothetical protein